MGFQRKRYKLTWADGTTWAGLEVVTKPPSMDVLLSLDELQAQALKGDVKAIREVVGLFEELITEWNVTDDQDQPVPVSAAELLSDVPMTLAIVLEYGEKVAAAHSVPPPLPRPSGSGPGNPVSPLKLAEIPMEPLAETEDRAS